MGLRLPLDSVPWVAKSEYPYLYPRDPMDPRLPPLPRHFLRQAQLLKGRPEASAKSARGVERPQEKPDKAPLLGQSAPWVIRTALCVQPRDGRLHVFMPPVATTEDGKCC
jgi:uncharacterized protein (DUF2126 family)